MLVMSSCKLMVMKIFHFCGRGVYVPWHGTNTKLLDEAKTRVQSEIKDLESQCAALRNIMSDTKTQLYAKFGNLINLEAKDY